MKLYDRYLIIRRAVIIALSPSTENVMFGYKDKTGKLKVHNIYSDYDKATDMYLDYWKNLFIKNSKTAESLKTKLMTFNKLVQDEWNSKNMKDQLRLIKEVPTEYKTSSKDRLWVKNVMNGTLSIKGMIKVIESNKYNAFVELYIEDKDFIDNVNSLIEQFMSKLDSVFYTANGLESDRDFAISVGHYHFAYVLWLARKSGQMVDHVFNNMPLYYRVKMINQFIMNKINTVKK